MSRSISTFARQMADPGLYALDIRRRLDIDANHLAVRQAFGHVKGPQAGTAPLVAIVKSSVFESKEQGTHPRSTTVLDFLIRLSSGGGYSPARSLFHNEFWNIISMTKHTSLKLNEHVVLHPEPPDLKGVMGARKVVVRLGDHSIARYMTRSNRPQPHPHLASREAHR